MEKIILFDISKELCEAWKKEFEGISEVEVQNVSVEDLECKTIVTAGNSYGIMSGGIDLAVRNMMGIGFQDALQNCIMHEFDGVMFTGESVMLGNEKRSVIYAPTMRYPSYIKNNIGIFYVFASVLMSYDNLDELACCGLGTGCGGVTPQECAYQMRKAYDYVKEQEKRNGKENH